MKNKLSYLYLLTAAILLASCSMQVPDYSLPTIQTLKAINITASEATLGMVITSYPSQQSFVQRAIDISTNASMQNTSRIYIDKEPISIYLTDNNNDVNITTLESNTKYYYRAVLVKDSKYSTDIYGEIESFITEQAPAPIIADIEMGISIESIISNSFIITVEYTPHNCTLKEAGFLLGDINASSLTLHNHSYKYQEGKTNYIRSQVSGLPPATSYYVRAYAIDTDNNEYYGAKRQVTTRAEAGGPLTIDDFTGTYTFTAYMPWQDDYITWNNIQIIGYTNDTVLAVGFNGQEELIALGIFHKGLQVVRFESGWYFKAHTVDIDGSDCVAVFSPAEYKSSNDKAYWFYTGGHFGAGEIWLRKAGNSYSFIPSDGISVDGYYANGFLFVYYTLNKSTNLINWENRIINTDVYTNITGTRISTTTDMTAPAKHKIKGNIIKQINNEIQNSDRKALAAPIYMR